MNIETISVGPFEVNCILVWGAEKQALVVDPGCDAARIKEALDCNGLQVAAYLLTHGHADHLCALNDLYTAHPAPVFLHACDEKWAFLPQNQIPPYYPVPEKPEIAISHPETSILWNIHDVRFHCLETPGHTPGCVCYYFEKEKILISGDTLFKGTCGRTDLPGGDGRLLAKSLKRLAALPAEVAVYPGHNESTTIGVENRTNVFMQQAAR